MHFPYGEILPEIPAEFVPPDMWPEYGALADPVPICRRELVSESPVAVRWGVWPLFFEQYWGDQAPDLGASGKRGELAYNRLVLWRRLHDGPAPRGWHRAMGRTVRVDGYQRLEGDFTTRWNKNARRDLRLWQADYLNKTHHIEPVSFDEYAIAYKKSLISKREGNYRLNELEHKLTVPLSREHTIMLGVRNRSGDIVAGSAVIFSPICKSSTHLAPFIKEEGRATYAATALIHHWFEESLRRGLPVVMSTNFWHPGKPKSWKGFSEFKSHFGFQFVEYPPALWRFKSGKLL